MWYITLKKSPFKKKKAHSFKLLGLEKRASPWADTQQDSQNDSSPYFFCHFKRVPVKQLKQLEDSWGRIRNKQIKKEMKRKKHTSNLVAQDMLQNLRFSAILAVTEDAIQVISWTQKGREGPTFKFSLTTFT